MKKVPCEVYSRITGYMRPTMAWGPGKRQEFRDRKVYDVAEARKTVAEGRE